MCNANDSFLTHSGKKKGKNYKIRYSGPKNYKNCQLVKLQNANAFKYQIVTTQIHI